MPHRPLKVLGKYRVAFLATRDIAAGEELLWDYGVRRDQQQWMKVAPGGRKGRKESSSHSLKDKVRLLPDALYTSVSRVSALGCCCQRSTSRQGTSCKSVCGHVCMHLLSQHTGQCTTFKSPSPQPPSLPATPLRATSRVPRSRWTELKNFSIRLLRMKVPWRRKEVLFWVGVRGLVRVVTRRRDERE